MKRPLSTPMRSILTDFLRAPIKRRREYSDGEGHVLKLAINHYDQRSFNALVSRKLLDFFKRCMCEGPCCCDNNGWHITPAGVEALSS